MGKAHGTAPADENGTSSDKPAGRLSRIEDRLGRIEQRLEILERIDKHLQQLLEVWG